MNQTTWNDIERTLLERGDERYSGEPVSHLTHALQAAEFARLAGCSDSLVVACLLHDIGHFLSDLTGTPSARGVNDQHEYRAAHTLRAYLPKSVIDPIRLHVKAKRYLVSDLNYLANLSEDSKRSLMLQGGHMSPAERSAFELEEFHQDALQLRRFDDLAKDPHFKTQRWESYWAMANKLRIA
jgi:predicted HD phosphohydrolase